MNRSASRQQSLAAAPLEENEGHSAQATPTELQSTVQRAGRVRWLLEEVLLAEGDAGHQVRSAHTFHHIYSLYSEIEDTFYM